MYKPIYIYLHVVSNNNKIYEKRKIVKVKIKEENQLLILKSFSLACYVRGNQKTRNQ